MRTVYAPNNIFEVHGFECLCCHNPLDWKIENGVEYITCPVCEDFKKCIQCNISIIDHDINNSCLEKLCYKCLLPTCDSCGGKVDCRNCIRNTKEIVYIDAITITFPLPECGWCGGKIDCKNCIDATT